MNRKHAKQIHLIETISGVEITFGGKKDERQVVIPDMLIYSPELFDDVISACALIAEEHASSKKDTRKTMEKYLSVNVPDLSRLLEYDKILDALWTFTESLAELIRDKKNTIWSFIIRNSFRPAMLKQQFDFIIGNPPWLAYGYITDPEYQKEVKQRARGDYEIAPESETHFATMELATLFLAHSLATFSNGRGQIAFVMPRSILTADQHQKLRERRYSSRAKLRLTGWWDLREVFPLFKVPSCVLFGHYDLSAPGQHKREVLGVQEWSGRLPREDVTWETAKDCLAVKEKKGKLIWLGRRSAFSTSSLGATAPFKASKYQAVFKAGANLLPRAFYFVRLTDFDVSRHDFERPYWAETDPEQPKKKPYQDVTISNYVEGRFICSTALARHLLPFVLLEPIPIVLPIEVNEEGDIALRTSEQLREDGYRDMAKWMEQAETTFVKKREDKSGRASLAEWTDYQGQLTIQNLKQRHIVLYNSVGTNVSAAHFDRRSSKLPCVVDQQMYWAAFSDAREAEYLVGILNSHTANQMIKPFQSMGLLGQRHIHKKLLELPIPLFDANNPHHKKLADLSVEAGNEAARAVKAEEFPRKMLARQRDYVRANIQPILKEIDVLVKQVFQAAQDEMKAKP